MVKPRADPLKLDASAQPPYRMCDVPGCLCEGQFRAPQSRDQLDVFYWFCIDHVRDYNARWNYYAGMSDAQIENEIRRDTVWQRPTWPMGWNTTQRRFQDPFNVGGEAHRKTRGQPFRKQTPEAKALALFELEPSFSYQDLKKRYKVLVKKHHPDANGGDKAAEEQLKVINEAYALLKKKFAS